MLRSDRVGKQPPPEVHPQLLLLVTRSRRTSPRSAGRSKYLRSAVLTSSSSSLEEKSALDSVLEMAAFREDRARSWLDLRVSASVTRSVSLMRAQVSANNSASVFSCMECERLDFSKVPIRAACIS